MILDMLEAEVQASPLKHSVAPEAEIDFETLKEQAFRPSTSGDSLRG
jgi:hypothetical protein